MATIEQIRNTKRAIPFRPFTVQFVNGRTFAIRHPDSIALPPSPRGRDLTVHPDDGPPRIDIDLVESVHAEPTPSSTGGDEA
jgi:hypothetical protein